MAVVIAVENDDGRLGACTARCYDAAPGTRCVCICGGENHGIGELAAMAHAREVAARWHGKARVELDPQTDQIVIPEAIE